jgi:hypothetical protein
MKNTPFGSGMKSINPPEEHKERRCGGAQSSRAEQRVRFTRNVQVRTPCADASQVLCTKTCTEETLATHGERLLPIQSESGS